MRIVLNGVEKSFFEERLVISFDNLVRLAGLPSADTITYHKSSMPNHPDGTLLPGEWVRVKDGTVINVTTTSSA